MFLPIFAALVTLHVHVDGKHIPMNILCIFVVFWPKMIGNGPITHFILSFQGFFFFNFHTCSARCRSGYVERLLPPGITCDEPHSGRDGSLECLGDIGQNEDPLICYGCTPDVTDKLSRWQSG
ncbi:unnamed protein product [Ixodes persulcatus]